MSETTLPAEVLGLVNKLLEDYVGQMKTASSPRGGEPPLISLNTASTAVVGYISGVRDMLLAAGFTYDKNREVYDALHEMSIDFASGHGFTKEKERKDDDDGSSDEA